MCLLCAWHGYRHQGYASDKMDFFCCLILVFVDLTFYRGRCIQSDIYREGGEKAIQVKTSPFPTNFPKSLYPERSERTIRIRKWENRDFPGGAVVKNTPARAGDTGSSPGPGRSHMPRNNWAREPQLLSLHSRAREPQLLKPACLEPELRNKRSHCNEKPTHHNEE